MLETLQKKGYLIMGHNSLQGENQQVSLEVKMGWFGGILDGEGYIGVSRYIGRYVFAPKIEIVNTNKIIIDSCIDCLKQLKVPHYVRNIPGTKRYKEQWRILIYGFKRTQKLLPNIIPYLIGKKEVAILLLELVNSRLQFDYNSVSPEKRKWTNEQLKIADKIMNFNKRKLSKTSTTIRQA